MYCWKCGQENTQGVSQCVHCGVSLERSAPTTEVGAALRQLYDHYGAETLLTNLLLMVNGLGDLLQESGKFRDQLKVALNSGIGKVYLQQIQTAGKPDPDFMAKIQKTLTEDAELSETAAKKITDAFDEMIGWNATVKVSPEKTEEIHQSETRELSQPQMAESQQKQREENAAPPKKRRRILLFIGVLFTVAAVFLIVNQNQHNDSVKIADEQSKQVVDTDSISNTSTPVTPTPSKSTPIPETPTPSKPTTESDANNLSVKWVSGEQKWGIFLDGVRLRNTLSGLAKALEKVIDVQSYKVDNKIRYFYGPVKKSVELCFNNSKDVQLEQMYLYYNALVFRKNLPDENNNNTPAEIIKSMADLLKEEAVLCNIQYVSDDMLETYNVQIEKNGKLTLEDINNLINHYDIFTIYFSIDGQYESKPMLTINYTKSGLAFYIELGIQYE